MTLNKKKKYGKLNVFNSRMILADKIFSTERFILFKSKCNNTIKKTVYFYTLVIYWGHKLYSRWLEREREREGEGYKAHLCTVSSLLTRAKKSHPACQVQRYTGWYINSIPPHPTPLHHYPAHPATWTLQLKSHSCCVCSSTVIGVWIFIIHLAPL